MKNAKVEIDSLLEVIESLDTAYELGEECIHPHTGLIVTDTEYDAIRKKLTDLLSKYDKDNAFLKQPTLSTVTASKKVKHNPPMTSISKANGTLAEKEDILSDWIKKVMTKLNYSGDKKNGNPIIAQSFKRDGVAVSIEYVNGKLSRAGLRPQDGINGEDVTENIKYVEGVLETLPIPVTLTIRGELECKISVFNKMNEKAIESGEKGYSNPRNYTYGSINQSKDPKETKNRCISFTGYTIENFDKAPYSNSIDRAKWCNQTLKIPFVRVEPFVYSSLAKMESMVSTLDYEVDGIVLEVNDLEDQEQMGRHGDSQTGNPLGKLAWKFKEKSAKPTVKNIVWQTGRQGKITPVLEFDAVPLAGTMVKRCTAHNVGIVTSKGIGIGAVIEIIKSGKIIPKVIDVVKRANKVDIVDVCPSCGSKLELIKGNDAEELYCNNGLNCPAQNIGKIVNYLSVIGVKGLAESIVEGLIDSGLVKKLGDLYNIDYNTLIKSGFSERTSVLFLARIKMLSNPEKIQDNKILLDKVSKAGKPLISSQDFIAAMGISNAGKGTARGLSKFYNGDIQRLLSATMDELKSIDEIGDITANSIFEFIKGNKDEIIELLDHVDIEKPKTGKLTGKSFVFTGTFEKKRSELQKMVEDLGGKSSGSVSKKVDYVVVGEDAGSKKDEAEKLNIKILDINGFYDIIKE